MLVGALTSVAAISALVGNLEIAVAALALVMGIAAAVAIDSWHELHDAKGRRAALGVQLAELTESQRGGFADVVQKLKQDHRHQTSEVEALLQVVPRVMGGAVLPASGGYAMDARALAELSDVIASRAPRLVVELGSGTSTVWVAKHMAALNGRIVSVDHLESYGEATRAQLRRQGLTDVAEVRISPLVEVAEGRRWYDSSVFADLGGIDLLIVDGPPGAINKNAREPALGALRSALAPGAVVVLDDISRPDEKEVLQAWLEAWPEFTRVDSGTSSLAVIAMSED